MAINHYRVSPKFWPKARARGWSDQQITLALYLLTCKHRNLEGLYVLPKPYIAADLGWPVRRVDELLATLIGDGFAQYDETSQVVLIPKALKHQSPSTERQVLGAIAQLRAIPRTCLWDAFRMACRSHCERLADAIDKEWSPQLDAISHAHAGSRADATSSSSTSRTNPPQPPAPRGEQGNPTSAQGQERPANSRAHGTNPRALAQAKAAAAGEIAAKAAAAALHSPDDEHVDSWERIRMRLRSAVSSSSWAVHLEPARLAGVTVDGGLVIDGRGEAWSGVVNRRRLITEAAEAESVPLRLATAAEHQGFELASERVAA